MRMDQSRGHHGRRRPQHLPAADLARVLCAVRRGAVRAADRRRASSASAQTRAVHVERPAGRARPRRRSRRPPGAPAATRPSARSRRCASRSTTSSALLERALPAALDASPSAAGSSSCRTSRSRTGSSSSALRARTVSTGAAGRARRLPEQDQPELRLLTRGAEQAVDDEVAANPRAASVRRACGRATAGGRMSTSSRRPGAGPSRPIGRLAASRLTVVARAAAASAAGPVRGPRRHVLVGGLRRPAAAEHRAPARRLHVTALRDKPPRSTQHQQQLEVRGRRTGRAPAARARRAPRLGMVGRQPGLPQLSIRQRSLGNPAAGKRGDQRRRRPASGREQPRELGHRSPTLRAPATCRTA